MRQLTFSVDDKVYQRLTDMARQRDMSTGPYAKVLFEAAYAARHRQSGDPDLDARVGLAVVLLGAKQDSATIAKAIGLSEPTVLKIIDAWKREAA